MHTLILYIYIIFVIIIVMYIRTCVTCVTRKQIEMKLLSSKMRNICINMYTCECVCVFAYVSICLLMWYPLR